MSDLVQLSGVPPLRQSTIEVMSCPKFYVESMIKGRKMPSGLDSVRGTQVHETMAAYLSHCARIGRGSDIAAFDELSRGAGPQAAKILVGLRDSFEVEHDRLLATEIKMALDENFAPTNISDEISGETKDSGNPAAYEGTLDGIYVFREEWMIRIDDFKSHLVPFEPESKPQSQQYALFVFKHFPWVQTVKFRLIFVRYRNLTREVTYTRDMVPNLIDAVSAARERQKVLHTLYASGADIEAIPGAQCVYCPMLADRSCPIAEFNYEMQLTLTDRLKFNLWYSAFNRVNNAVMKDHVNGTGRQIVLRDYNGKIYTYGPVDKEVKVYPVFRASPKGGLLRDHNGMPVLPIIDLLLDHADVNPDDTDWMPKLVISASKMNSSLKAKSRVNVHQAISDEADTITKVSLRVSKPLDVLEDDEDEELDDDDFEDF